MIKKLYSVYHDDNNQVREMKRGQKYSTNNDPLATGVYSEVISGVRCQYFYLNGKYLLECGSTFQFEKILKLKAFI